VIPQILSKCASALAEAVRARPKNGIHAIFGLEQKPQKRRNFLQPKPAVVFSWPAQGIGGARQIRRICAFFARSAKNGA
jgi:hypothetical protein